MALREQRFTLWVVLLLVSFLVGVSQYGRDWGGNKPWEKSHFFLVLLGSFVLIIAGQ